MWAESEFVPREQMLARRCSNACHDVSFMLIIHRARTFHSPPVSPTLCFRLWLLRSYTAHIPNFSSHWGLNLSNIFTFIFRQRLDVLFDVFQQQTADCGWKWYVDLFALRQSQLWLLKIMNIWNRSFIYYEVIRITVICTVVLGSVSESIATILYKFAANSKTW